MTFKVACSKIVKSQLSKVNCQFRVEDTGIGIPESHLEDIFEPFRQVAEETHRLDGSAGLGLAISRELVRLMGGELHVRSTSGKGSLFWFELNLPEVHEKEYI